MAVPAHVRNDMTSHLFNGLNVSKWMSNPFEKYVIAHFAAINDTPVKPVFSAPMRLSDFWDKNSYTDQTSPSAGTDQGLAEYTNANFVSDFTIFRPVSDTGHYFKYPSEATSVDKVHYTIADPIKPGQTITRTYYQKTGDGDDGYRLAGVGFLNRWSMSLTPLKRVSPMDDYVHDDYAKKILPRAVGYSAALLDYFFRGKFNLTVATPDDITFRSIKLTAQNDTPNEAMETGDVSLVIRYKALTETGSGPVKTVNFPSADYSYKVVKLQNVDLSNPRELTFDLSADPLPLNFSDMTIQLVYKGPLGNETDAVAVSPPKPIDGIYTDFTVSLPSSGVYAKTADNSPTATFNELRVSALTDIPGGLSGGTFSLALEYRTAIGDQFQSVLVDTDPADASGYIYRNGVMNGVTSLAQGVPTELVFDLSSSPIPVSATDVQINVVYTDNATSKVAAVGVRDISEPTPVDIYNNTDYTCINSTWYHYDDPEAIAISNESDIYPHAISNISFLAGPAGAGTLDASASNTLFAAGSIQPGDKWRLGYILTDYTNRYAFSETRTGQNGDTWSHTINNRNFPGTGFRNDADTWSSMYSFRGKKMWWGEGVIFINQEYNGSCTWDALNQKLGL